MTRGPDSERGFVVVQVIAICMIVFLVGGVALDLWRAYSTERALAAAVDSAAAAGATAIDEAAYRPAGGSVRLVAPDAHARACAMLERTEPDATCDVTVAGDSITVKSDKPFRLTILGPFVPDADPHARADATASPR